MSASEFPGAQCPYLATSCPLLKPFAASFANGDGSNGSQPSPSACASAHSSPQNTLPAQTSRQGESSTYDRYGGSSVPIHTLHGPTSGYDGHGQGQAQYEQHLNRHEPGRRPTDSQPSYPSQQSHASSSSAYPRPSLETRDSTYTASSSTSTSTSTHQNGDAYRRSSRSPPRDYLGEQASSSYSHTNAEPPTPNSFLRSPPLGPIAHLQQPVFPHHQPPHSSLSDPERRPDHQRYDSSSSVDAYGTYPTSSTFDNGRDYVSGAASSSFPSGSGRGGYGSFGAEDIEDLSFNRSQPQTYPGLVPAEEERKVFATLQEVHAPEEAVGEQTAFISKLWHLLTHPEYARYLRWSKDGQAFILTNSNEFAIKVLPRFFRHSNVASFVRQLNLYSFQRVSTIRLLDMADSSTSTSINPSHEPHTSSHAHTTHHAFGPDSDSEDHHSSHSGGSPGPSGNADNSTVTASGFSHVHFQRDHPELLKLLKPRGSTRKSTSSTVAAKKAAAVVRDEEDRRGGLKRAASSSSKTKK